MDNGRLLDAAIGLVKELDSAVDDTLPIEISNIVKSHAKGAAIAGLAAGWVPGFGGAAATAIAGGFIWTMYVRISSRLNLSLTENIIKSLASAIATNIAAYALGSVVLASAFSLFPGLGSVASSAIVAGTCYALALASGIVYLKLLTDLFKAGKDPTKMTAENLKKAAKKVVENEDIKAVIKEAKNEFKAAKERGEIKNEE